MFKEELEKLGSSQEEYKKCIQSIYYVSSKCEKILGLNHIMVRLNQQGANALSSTYTRTLGTAFRKPVTDEVTFEYIGIYLDEIIKYFYNSREHANAYCKVYGLMPNNLINMVKHIVCHEFGHALQMTKYKKWSLKYLEQYEDANIRTYCYDTLKMEVNANKIAKILMKRI